MALVLIPLSVVAFAVSIVVNARAVAFSLHVIAFIAVAVLENGAASAIGLSVVKATGIDRTVFERV